MNAELERLSIGPDSTVREAMEAIDRGACEIALVVDRDRRLIGTVTDGDVRRALLADAPLDAPVSKIVSRDPYTVTPKASRAEVLDLMNARSIEQVPVVEPGGTLVGLHIMRELIGGRERENSAVVLAGGRGTRLGSLTKAIPKPMLPVAGRPILERIVLHLVGSGIRRIVLSVGYLAEVIEDYFGDGAEFGCRIEYVREDPDRPLGTGGPLGLVGAVPDPPKEPLLLMNGDLVTEFGVGDLFDHHEEAGAMITVTYREHHYEVPYGVLDIDHRGGLMGLVEKPVMSWPLNAGVYVIDPVLLSRVPEGVEFPVTDLVADCLERSEIVATFEIDGEWHDVGHPETLRRARGEQ